MIPRRLFLEQALAGAALCAAGTLAAAETTLAAPSGPSTAESAGLTAYQLGPQIWVRLNNKPVTCYRAHPTQKYPYLYPVSGPVSGLSLTSETSLPWPHHRSLFFACDRVNDGNYWQEEYDKGQIVSLGPRLGKTTKETVEILDTCEWRKPSMPAIMKDRRRIVIDVANPDCQVVDWDIEWSAIGDVTIQKTNHSLFSLRAADDIAVTGGGTLENAEGLKGEKATFGQASAWCAFYGRRASADVVEGIALMQHPANPWPSCPWFTRDYGFISPTQFNFIDESFKLKAGASVRLRYRVALFKGSPKEAGLNAIFKKWTSPS